MPRVPRCLPVHLALAAALVLAGAACGSGDDDAADPPPEQPTTTQPTTTLSQEQQDEMALRELMEEWYRQSAVVGGEDAPDPSLFVTGRYLDFVLDQIEDERASGETYQRGSAGRQVVESITVDGDEATITSCQFEQGTYRSDDGEIIEETNNTFRFSTMAIRTDDGWRLSWQEQIGETEEGDRCPAT